MENLIDSFVNFLMSDSPWLLRIAIAFFAFKLFMWARWPGVYNLSGEIKIHGLMRDVWARLDYDDHEKNVLANAADCEKVADSPPTYIVGGKDFDQKENMGAVAPIKTMVHERVVGSHMVTEDHIGGPGDKPVMRYVSKDGIEHVVITTTQEPDGVVVKNVSSLNQPKLWLVASFLLFNPVNNFLKRLKAAVEMSENQATFAKAFTPRHERQEESSSFN